MYSMQEATRCLAMAVIVATLLVACESGPSESEFVAACLNEGRQGANKAMSRAMSIDRDKFCKCGASQARANLSPDGYRLMVFEMQGKRQQVAALQSTMNDTEKMNVMKAGFELLGKCVSGG
jgi:hypothetical protein